MRNFVAIALVLAAAGPALAKDLRVGKGQTYESIQAAVDAAAPGDRIVVMPGVYPENVTVTTERLVFLGKKAVWDGTRGPDDAGTCLSGAGNGIVVQGFTFRAGTGHVDLQGDGIVVRNCVSSGAPGPAFRITGASARVERSTVRGAGSAAIRIDGTGARALRNRVVSCDQGITLDGDDAGAESNTVQNTDSTAIAVRGDRARAKGNRVASAYGSGVFVEGDGAYAGSNRVAQTSSSAVQVRGDGVVVERNAVDGCSSTGIDVVGDSIRVTRNVVSQAVDDSDAYYIASRSEAGGGTVERNTAVDCIEYGFYVHSQKVEFTANKAIRTGSEDEGGWYVGGNENTLTSCVAQDCDKFGFQVSGSGNALRSCRATANTACGFVVHGDGNVLDRCTALAHPAEGVANHGTGTDLIAGTYLGNRQDVTRASEGTWGEWVAPKFRTGGKDETPLLD